MSLQFVSGDPRLTQCDALAIGHNRLGRIELDPVSQMIMQTYPTACASYTRHCKKGRQNAGEIFIWTQSTPKLLFLTVCDSSVGATRLRHVQKCLMTLARDYRYYGIKSLAIAPIGNPHEQSEIIPMYSTWFANSKLQVIVYEAYQPNISAEINEMP